MPEDLIVARGTTVVLSDNPPPELAVSMKRLQVTRLSDLVDEGIVSSVEVLTRMLASAQAATDTALTSRDTFTPFVPIPGTTRPDLRRYGSFIAGVPDVRPTDAQSFWRIVRGIPPERLASVDRNSDLSPLLDAATLQGLGSIVSLLSNNVTVESDAVLHIKDSVSVFRCGDLLIRRFGRIVVQGSGVRIVASSIQGEQ